MEKVESMQKSLMLEAIEKAKETHLEQFKKIELAMLGEEVQSPTPISKMECACGVWFHDNSNMMEEILGMQLYERLDALHEKWHVQYKKIHEIFFEEKKQGLISKILSLRGMNQMTLDKVKLYVLELKLITDEIFALSDTAQRRIQALSKSKFQ